MTSPVERVAVGGATLAYRSAGEGRALVCVHGNFASKRWFGELLARPPRGWRVLAIDLPNFGDASPMPGPISLGAYARYLQGALEALGLTKPVVLGHSLGGAVVQALAARAPEAVAGLVLLDSAPPQGLATPTERYAALPLLRGNAQLMARALAATMPARTPPYFQALVGDALRMRPEAFTDNARALERMDVATQLSRFAGPVLVLRGERDYLVSEAMARATAAAFPQGRLVQLAGVGRSPQIEAPEAFSRLLSRSLEEVP